MEKNVIRIEAEPTREDANRIIAERREAVRAYVLEKLKETNTATPASDLLFGLFPIQEGNPYREIVNISACVSVAMSEAWRLFFEVEHLRRELAELKGREIEDVKCTLVE